MGKGEKKYAQIQDDSLLYGECGYPGLFGVWGTAVSNAEWNVVYSRLEGVKNGCDDFRRFDENWRKGSTGLSLILSTRMILWN